MTREVKYKICWSCLVISASIFFALWNLMSCNKQNLDELREIPKLESSSSDMRKHEIGLYFSQQKAFNWVDTKVPTDIRITLFDVSYKPVDYYFFLKFNIWFGKLKFENGIMPIDQKENLDCDNFAMLYKSLMGISGYKSSQEREPSVAVVVVRQKREFGGIPASNRLHMVNLIMTNNGWFILEPQSNKFILLEEYPNQEFIEYLIF